MLEIRSALTGCMVPGRYGIGAPGITFAERPIGCLMQLAGWPSRFEQAALTIMQRLGFENLGDYQIAQGDATKAAFHIAPETVLLSFGSFGSCGGWEGAAVDVDQDHLVMLDLSHAKVRIAIDGSKAKDLLARVLPIDLHDEVFKEGHFAQTGFNSISVLLHRLQDRKKTPMYDLYVPYTLAASIWHTLTSNALPFGYEVVEAAVMKLPAAHEGAHS
jgi:sarcosine oxidase subunit gamma